MSIPNGDLPTPPWTARPPAVHLPARLCADIDEALRHEWLVTNGIGGFASGTVAGALARRYHGLLLAALQPPLGRTLLVAKLDETAVLGGHVYALHTNIWKDGPGPAPGCRWLRRFDLVLGIPTWCFELPAPGAAGPNRGTGPAPGPRPCRLIKRIWMEPGHNITYVQYELDECGTALALTCTLLVNARDYHALRHGQDAVFEVRGIPGGLRVRPVDGEPAVTARCCGHIAATALWCPDHTWYRDFRLPMDEARGYDCFEDHLCAGRCAVTLEPGHVLTFALSAEPDTALDATTALIRRQNAAVARLAAFEQRGDAGDEPVPPAVRQLVLAADQFIVSRPDPHTGPPAAGAVAAGHTVIAGYPWFTDWGRDTMIALPGLTLCTGRFDVARQVLQTWGRYVERGMIPNRFPDRGAAPEYHTADASLWYLWAIDQYVQATGDRDMLAELFPRMADIIAWHRRGTRHNLRVGEDGLVEAGEPGLNLTWMDAKIGERAVTPRIGKPIELSALWYDALCNLSRLAGWLAKPAAEYERLAERTRASFARYWNPARGGCYDVLDGPDGSDGRLRPNQIFAVSLRHSPLPPEQQRAVVAVCTRELLTWFGLRSLGRGEPGYRGRYGGNPVTRDEAYHQGTAWGWLLGPFVIAHFRVHRDAAQACRFLLPKLGQLWTHGVGSLSEVFDGDEPHAANGCIAQAWSVAETLRAWLVTQHGLPL